MRSALVKELAGRCGFELAGIARAEPLPEAGYYREWAGNGMAGEMAYLTGRRGEMRADPRTLLPTACSIVCVGKLYNGPQPYSRCFTGEELGWISRYAWGDDYHNVLRSGLERLAAELKGAGAFDWKICVDTAPLVERAYARRAGLGWIGKNTCLIREGQGSWFFLGELLTSLDLEPDSPPPDRCGSCTRCIEACPTEALVPTGLAEPAYALDSRRCISYFTIDSAVRFRSRCASAWGIMFSAATSAKTCARGTAERPSRASRHLPRGILRRRSRGLPQSRNRNSARCFRARRSCARATRVSFGMSRSQWATRGRRGSAGRLKSSPGTTIRWSASTPLGRSRPSNGTAGHLPMASRRGRRA